MGDVILLTPLLSYLKEKNPAAEITVITGSPYAVLFGDDPRLTSVVPYVRSDEEKIFTKLALEKWDHVIDLQNNRRSRKLRKKYFPQVNFGVFDKLHVQRFLLLLVRLDFYKKSSNVAQRYILAADNTQESIQKIPPVKLYGDSGRVKKHQVFQGGKSEIIALFPFSAWKNKQWPVASYAAIGRHFAQKNWGVTIFGGAEDAAKAEKLKGEIGENCYSFAGTLNLYEIGCYLTQCTLALGGDTGLSGGIIHLQDIQCHIHVITDVHIVNF